MNADGSVDLIVAFCRKEEQLDTAGLLLPLVADNRLHDVSFWLFVASKHSRRSVPGFQPLPSAVQEFFVRNKIPIGMLILKLDFHERLFLAKVEDRSFEGRLDQPFDGPSIAPLYSGLVNYAGTGSVQNSGYFFLAFGPIESERRVDLRINVLTVRKTEDTGDHPQNPDAYGPHI